MSTSDEIANQDQARNEQIEAIVALCSGLDEAQAWLCQDFEFGGQNDCHEAAAFVLDMVRERLFEVDAAPYIAAGVVFIHDAAQIRSVAAGFAAATAFEGYWDACCAAHWIVESTEGSHCDDGYMSAVGSYVAYVNDSESDDAEAPWDEKAFRQAAADVTWGYAVGCLTNSEDVEERVREALACVRSDEALGVVRSRFEYLRDRHRAWQRKRRQRVLMIALCGAIACGVGMVLPMCWGALFPWALQVWGAVVGGLLGYKAACAEPSAGGVVLMLVGWALVGLGVGCLLWGVWPLVASYSTALATVMGAVSTTLCVGGAGSLWSKRVETGWGWGRLISGADPEDSTLPAYDQEWETASGSSMSPGSE